MPRFYIRSYVRYCITKQRRLRERRRLERFNRGQVLETLRRVREELGLPQAAWEEESSSEVESFQSLEIA